MSYRNLLILLAATAFTLALGCSGDTVGGATTKLAAECTPAAAELPDGAWVCLPDSSDDDLTVDCEDREAIPDDIYFEPAGEPPSCEGIALSLEDEGPFPVGTHDIVIYDGEDEETRVQVCDTQLTVKDELAPVPNEEPIELWPPNHKFHTISGEDCVQDACDDNVAVTFNRASSDESVNANGDGNTEPDIILECDRVQLRSERQGGGNGRTYRLGWTAVDASGNAAAGECVVRVPHDQSGKDVDDDDAEAYHMDLHPNECDDGTGGTGRHGGDGGGGGGGDGGGDGGGGGGGGVVVVL
jgi:hypothetical protein